MARLSRERRAVYRQKSTGRFISYQASREVESERMAVVGHRTKAGKFLRALEVLSSKTTTKTVQVPQTGEQAGLLWMALEEARSARVLKGAKRFEIEISGKDRRGKTHRFRSRFSHLKPMGGAKASHFMLWSLLEAMRRRGYRTSYRIEEVDFTLHKYPKTKSRHLKPLTDVTIRITGKQ